MSVTIKPGKRTGLVQEYYFSIKRKQLDEMKKSGIEVINLGIGSPDLPPAPDVIASLCRNAGDPHNHGYQSYIGTPELRKAYSVWYNKHFGVSLNPENEILPLVGSKEGIMHISMAFLDEGDEVLIPDPGYPTYEAATKIAGGKVRYYDLKEENGWLLDINKIESENLDNVKIMWVNYPNMPTGCRANRTLFSNLVSFALKHRILLVNDNPYSFILNDEHLSILSMEGAKEVALELNSLSKSHNMSGWRIGMVAGKPEYINAILKIKSNMDSGMFQPLQAAAVEALKAPDSWYSELNTLYRERRKAAEKIMNVLNCRYDQSQSGLFLWGRIPSECGSAEEFSDRILQSAHVFITPGHIFGCNGKNHIRISLCCPVQVMKEALDQIATALPSILK